MKLNISLFIAGVILAPMIATAGAIKTFDLNIGQINFQEIDRLVARLGYTGTIKKSGKKVSCRVGGLTYQGWMDDINCGELTNKCSATFIYASGDEVVAEVYGDLGSPQGSEHLGDLVLGTINEKDQVTLSSKFQFQSQFVQERVNLAEKIIGAKDRDYCAIQFQ